MLKADLTQTVGAVVRRSDGLILGTFCCSAQNQALTVAHVLDDVASPEAIGLHLGNQTVTIDQFTIDWQRGVASISAPLPHSLPLAPSKKIAVTSTVFVAGWPQLLLSDSHSGLRVLRTTVIRTLNPENRSFEVQGVFPKGFSGAAVLNEDGGLCGLLDELCTIDVGCGLDFGYGLARQI